MSLKKSDRQFLPGMRVVFTKDFQVSFPPSEGRNGFLIDAETEGEVVENTANPGDWTAKPGDPDLTKFPEVLPDGRDESILVPPDYLRVKRIRVSKVKVIV